MYRPDKVICKEEFPHWMPNTLKQGCQEAKGLLMDIKEGSVGVYNPADDLYYFDPVEAMESRGVRGSEDLTSPEYYKFWYCYYKNFRPTLRGDFIEISIGKPNGFFAVLEDKVQTTLF